MTLLAGRVTKNLFFGQLRDVEVELLYDNARYAVTETCLALTIFREELTTRVLTLFTALLFSKSFHWLCQSRVEYVESDNVSRWTHLRLLTLMGSLLVVDVAFVAGCVYFWKGPSVLILFGFEYTILAVSVLSTLVRYCLHIVDMSIEGNWPQKGSYLFFLEFATEVVRFLSYVVFFTIIFTYYGMPLHIVRDLWMSYVNLKRRLVIFNKYRKLTANMNERFPDASGEELAACEHTCIICRDAMEVGKKLPCAHIFHLDCLRLWLQQQQSCPTCRADIPTSDAPPAPAAAPAAAPAVVPPVPGAGAAGVAPQPPQQQPLAQQPRPGLRAVPPRQPLGAVPPAPQAAGAAPRFPVPAGLGGVGAGPANFPHPPVPNTAPGFPTDPSFPRPPTSAAAGGMGPSSSSLPPFLPPPPFFNNAWGMPGGPLPPALFGGGDPSMLPDFPERPFSFYRVAAPQGAQVRAGPEVTAAVVRTLPQHEMVLILDKADGGLYRVLGGGYILGESVLEAVSPPAPMMPPPFGLMPGMPFPDFSAGGGLGNSGGSSGSGSSATGVQGLSRSLVSLRLDLNEAKAGVEMVMEGLSVLVSKHQGELQKMQNVLTRLEQAHEALAAQAAAAEAPPTSSGGVEESKEGRAMESG